MTAGEEREEGGPCWPLVAPWGLGGCQSLIQHGEEQDQPSATLRTKWDFVVGF